MSVNVKLSEALVDQAKHYAAIEHRSLPKQIEYWSRIGNRNRGRTTVVQFFCTKPLYNPWSVLCFRCFSVPYFPRICGSSTRPSYVTN